MSKKLNPNAPIFVPRPNEEKGEDVIYIINNGKVREIKLNEDNRPTSYVGNSLRRESEAKEESSPCVYVNHFFGWTFPQIVDFMRSSTANRCLDVLYEAVRQRAHLGCIGVLMVYALQKGLTADQCERRLMQAFGRFFPATDREEYDMCVWILDREIAWAKSLC